MKIRVTTPARLEYQSAANFLIERNPPAARQFVDALDLAFQNLRDNPELGHLTENEPTYVLVLSSIPYKIFYEIEGDTIAILSIFHTSRELK